MLPDPLPSSRQHVCPNVRRRHNVIRVLADQIDQDNDELTFSLSYFQMFLFRLKKLNVSCHLTNHGTH